MKKRERDPLGNIAFCEAFTTFGGNRESIQKHLGITNHVLRAKLARLMKQEKYRQSLQPFVKNVNNKKTTAIVTGQAQIHVEEKTTASQAT